MSTLNKWITAHRDTDVVSKEDLSRAQENDRLRHKNRIFKEIGLDVGHRRVGRPLLADLALPNRLPGNGCTKPELGW